MSPTETKDTREHKVTCHYGLPDYYKDYKRNSKDPVDKTLYSKVLKDYLQATRDGISTFGKTFNFPERMGRIEMRKSKRAVKVDKEGKIVNNLPINWKETKKLWEENKEAEKKKVKIRYTNEHTNGYVFRPVYIKNTANYKNKTVYKLSINRALRRGSYLSIMNKRFDAFLLGPED